MTEISIHGKQQYRFLTYIFCSFITIQFVCDVLVMRLIRVGSLEFTASSIIFCLDFALMDVVANVYGMREARKLAFLNFGTQVFFGVVIYLFLFSFQPQDYSNLAYQTTAGQLKDFGLILAKCLVISPFGVLLGNLSNAFFMTTSKYLLYGRFIALRSLICSVSAAFLMLTFTYTIFYWNTGFSNILHVVLSSMVVKLIGGALLMGPSQLTSKLFKKLEGVDVYDLKFKFCQARHQKIMAIFDKNKRKGAE